MAILENEHDAPAVLPVTYPEVIPVPDDYDIILTGEDLDDVHVLEAYWNGEAKVAAQVDPIFEGEYIIDKIARPDFWGKDFRPSEEQQREFELGIDGILKSVISRGARGIELTEQSGVVAAAAANLRVPDGWRRSWTPVDYWAQAAEVSIQEVISAGAHVSMRYERMLSAPGDVGRVAATGSLAG
ncbi:MAG TPA: hypothetical protein VFP32_02855 [Candidatus Saccharimonadales bacterium]|nr:hypothetical protein [Candidatus Saccharimonadales bacterium]